MCVSAMAGGCTADPPPFQCTIDHCSVDRASGRVCCPTQSTVDSPACCDSAVHLVARACHPTTNQCYTFCDSCIPHGWVKTPGVDTGVGPDASSPDTVKACKPSFPITKGSCPWSISSTNKPCPEGQLCEDTRRCVKVGCNTGPDCSSKPEAFHIYGSLAGPQSPQTKILSGSVKIKSASLVEISSASETLYINLKLPTDLKLPLSNGDAATVKLCKHGTPINSQYFVVLHDAKGALVLAGGGIGTAGAGCLSQEATLARVSLDCAPFPSATPYLIPYPHTNFAIRVTADNTVTVPQGGRGVLKIAGSRYRVANFSSYHPIEWTATDVYGPVESLILVRE